MMISLDRSQAASSVLRLGSPETTYLLWLYEEQRMNRVKITYFSDALCVWAYISQVRIDELKSHFGEAIELDCRYLHVFGNVGKKIETGWKDRGGLSAYRGHVQEVVDQFRHVSVHPQTWADDVPKSSMPAHLLLCAVRQLEAESRAAPGATERAAWAVREAFFQHARDISRQDVLFKIADSLALPMEHLKTALSNGAAHAALAEDLDIARTQSITASPTLLFNEGRQRLTGNVGYRIIEANIRELLERAPGQLSWC
jgi:predicted DsbA family dithiol-disulfide isomerase